MQAMYPGKEVLPFPYDQNFSGIVTRVRGKRAATRAALVNSPKVAAYLRAGATLVETHLGSAGRPSPTGRKPYWSGIRFLTERAVIHEMEHNPAPFLSQKGAGPFRATWASHDDYINDLLAFLFHGMNYEPQYGEELQTREEWLIEGESFAAALDRVTYHEVQALCRMPLFRLQLIMVASAERNDGVHNAIAENYAGALEPWKKIYESTIAARGFRLRPGVTLDQFAGMLAGVAEGLAVRHLGDPGAEVLGDGPEGNLLGMAVLAILNSYLEMTTEPSGRSLRVDFEERARRARRDGEKLR
jgi:hypothetical protein